ncbi:MAG: DUF4912 domain-containing protein [Elusimicrobia bacterium]|nr:DUF4912 domain-containing protein [Elusimicrobiota bacterium]
MNSEIFYLPLNPLDPSQKSEAIKSIKKACSLPGQTSEKDYLLALPRDAHWLLALWELTSELQKKISSSRFTLRLRFAEDDKLAAEVPFEISKQHAYLRAPVPGRSYYLELGDLRSNVITLPHGSPADGSEKAPSPHSSLRLLSLA